MGITNSIVCQTTWKPMGGSRLCWQSVDIDESLYQEVAETPVVEQRVGEALEIRAVLRSSRRIRDRL